MFIDFYMQLNFDFRVVSAAAPCLWATSYSKKLCLHVLAERQSGEILNFYGAEILHVDVNHERLEVIGNTEPRNVRPETSDVGPGIIL